MILSTQLLGSKNWLFSHTNTWCEMLSNTNGSTMLSTFMWTSRNGAQKECYVKIVVLLQPSSIVQKIAKAIAGHVSEIFTVASENLSTEDSHSHLITALHAVESLFMAGKA